MSSACEHESDAPVASANAKTRHRPAGTSCIDAPGIGPTPGSTPARVCGGGGGCWCSALIPRPLADRPTARTRSHTLNGGDPGGEALTPNTYTPPRHRHTTSAPPHIGSNRRFTSPTPDPPLRVPSWTLGMDDDDDGSSIEWSAGARFGSDVESGRILIGRALYSRMIGGGPLVNPVTEKNLTRYVTPASNMSSTCSTRSRAPNRPVTGVHAGPDVPCDLR